MSMGGAGKVEQTPQQRANLQIANQQMQDWRTRWLPQLTNFSKHLDTMQAPNSFERRHATAQAGADTSMRFTQAGEQLNKASAASGTAGSAREKLGIVGLGNKEATSAGFGAVNADQSVDDAFVSGERAVASIGRGEKADTVNALGRSAAISGQQASADAENALNEQAGYAGLAAKTLGAGAGLWMGSRSGVPQRNINVANSSSDPIGSLNSQLGWTGT